MAAVDLDDLRAFVVLAELEHVTDAAAALRMPQSTLSRALGRLEAELGVQLFDRPGRRLRLNDYGRVLHDHARLALADLDTGTRRLATLRDPDRGAVRLGFLGSLGTWLVPRILTHYRRQVTGTTITLRAAASDALEELLVADRLDVVLVGPRPEGSEFAWHPLREEHLCLTVPAGHRLAGRATVHLADAADEPFVAYQADTGLRRISDRLYRAAGIDPRVALESADVATVDALVAAGMGVALRPTAGDATRLPGVVHVPLAEPEARRVIGMCWLRRRTASAAVDRFRRLALEALADGSAPSSR